MVVNALHIFLNHRKELRVAKVSGAILSIRLVIPKDLPVNPNLVAVSWFLITPCLGFGIDGLRSSMSDKVRSLTPISLSGRIGIMNLFPDLTLPLHSSVHHLLLRQSKLILFSALGLPVGGLNNRNLHDHVPSRRSLGLTGAERTRFLFRGTHCSALHLRGSIWVKIR